MKKFENKKLILFDLDGVLIDSLQNMRKTWKENLRGNLSETLI